jgi:hypothetical protein
VVKALCLGNPRGIRETAVRNGAGSNPAALKFFFFKGFFGHPVGWFVSGVWGLGLNLTLNYPEFGYFLVS